MKQELLKLGKEYLEALKEHHEGYHYESRGHIDHGPSFEGFIDWLEAGRIYCS